MERLNHGDNVVVVEEMGHTEAVEVLETIREVIGLGGLPAEGPQPQEKLPFYEVQKRILRALGNGEEMLLREVVKRVGKNESTMVCRELRNLLREGKVERRVVHGNWGMWKVARDGRGF